jgi:hypothetical protein
MQEYAAFGATSHSFQGAIELATKWVRGVMWDH